MNLKDGFNSIIDDSSHELCLENSERGMKDFLDPQHATFGSQETMDGMYVLVRDALKIPRDVLDDILEYLEDFDGELVKKEYAAHPLAEKIRLFIDAWVAIREITEKGFQEGQREIVVAYRERVLARLTVVRQENAAKGDGAEEEEEIEEDEDEDIELG